MAAAPSATTTTATRRVVVVGSGAAGLAAALAASHAGADVVVLEADDLIGGTTAISGGIAWAPGHPYGTDDSADEGLAYLREPATGDVDDRLYAAGNPAASPFGTATAAGGATIGPALVFGTRAGEAAAHD